MPVFPPAAELFAVIEIGAPVPVTVNAPIDTIVEAVVLLPFTVIPVAADKAPDWVTALPVRELPVNEILPKVAVIVPVLLIPKLALPKVEPVIEILPTAEVIVVEFIKNPASTRALELEMVIPCRPSIEVAVM